jgi:hypothetical protein
MASRGNTQRQAIATTDNAFLVAQHLDGSLAVIQPRHHFNLLYHKSVAGRGAVYTLDGEDVLTSARRLWL